MTILLAVSRVIDAINGAIGRWVSWLLLAAVLISAGNAVIRKVFDISSNAWLELQWYLFGTVFMLAAAYALLRNEHIRIDILSSGWKKRTRDWIDLILHTIFLVPFIGLAMYAVANDAEIMGKKVNSPFAKIGGAIGLLLLSGLAVWNFNELFL